MKFEQLPYWVRAGAYAAGGLRNAPLRYGPEYFRYRRLLRDSSTWSRARQERWQADALRALLREAFEAVPHYRESDARAALDDLQRRNAMEILARLPVLEKSLLKEQTARLMNGRRRGLVKSSTSGSTGSPLTVWLDWASLQRRQALIDDQIARCGVSPKARSVRLSGRMLAPANAQKARPWLLNPVERQLFVSSYHLGLADSALIAEKVAAFSPARIDGYPSAIVQLLRLLRREGKRLESLRLIITTAETLSAEVRAELEELSNAIVCDYYAASEGVPFIQQCVRGTYHVRWESGVFELRTPAGRIERSGDGMAVVTSFVQFKTPLIRYATGDLLEGYEPSPGPCPCGLQTPVIHRVVGRVEDLVKTRDGRSIGMFTYRTLKHVDDLIEAQVVQTDYEAFTVKCVVAPGARLEVIEAQLRDRFSRSIGAPASVALETCDQLPKGPNGKLRLVVSQIQD